MRFVSYLHNNEPSWGLVDGGVIADLSHCEPSLKAAIRKHNLAACAGAAATGKRVALDEITCLPPITGPVPYPLHRPELRRAPG